MKKNYLFYLIIFSFFSQTAFTQKRDKNGLIKTENNSVSLVFTVGTSRLYGDFRTSKENNLFREHFALQQIRYETTLGFRHSFANRLSYRVSLHHALYNQIDAIQEKKLPSIATNITMFTAIGEFNVLEALTVARPWRVYIYGGGGLAYASIDFDRPMVTAMPDVSFKESEFAPIIPLGLGFDMWITSNFNIGVEANYKYAFSDYMNGVRIANSRNDIMGSISLTVAYRLFRNKKDRWESLQ